MMSSTCHSGTTLQYGAKNSKQYERCFPLHRTGGRNQRAFKMRLQQWHHLSERSLFQTLQTTDPKRTRHDRNPFTDSKCKE